MKLFKSWCVILACSFLGEGLSYLLPIKIPGSVLGMLLLFLALHAKLVDVAVLEETSTWLLDHLSFFFLPGGVGIMLYTDLLADLWVELVLVTVVSTFITLLITGYVVQYLKERHERSRVYLTEEEVDGYVPHIDE